MCRGALPALDAGRREEQVAPAHDWRTQGPGGPGSWVQEPHMPMLLHAPAACLALQDPIPHGGFTQTAVSEACEHSPLPAMLIGLTGVIS